MMTLSRRNLFRSALVVCTCLSMPRLAKASTNYVVGAIRWDAWYEVGQLSDSSIYAQNNLSEPQWQFRAPSCATQVSPYDLSFASCDQQSAIDAEITAAHGSGLNYWAYGMARLPNNSSTDGFMNAWSFHQSSSIKNLMSWCMLLSLSTIGPASTLASNTATYITYMQQSNYQSVLGGRPLIYLLIDQNPPGQWTSFADFGASLNTFRSACAAAGLQNPYIVVMGAAYSIVNQIGGDAISNYMSLVATAVGGNPYSSQSANDTAYWTSLVATGGQVVPIVQCGWDTRPRRGSPLDGASNYIGDNVYLAPGTPAQIASNFQAAINFIAANAAACAAKVILAYSWTECDEGGSALVPEWTSSGPNAAILNAVATVLNAN